MTRTVRRSGRLRRRMRFRQRYGGPARGLSARVCGSRQPLVASGLPNSLRDGRKVAADQVDDGEEVHCVQASRAVLVVAGEGLPKPEQRRRRIPKWVALRERGRGCGRLAASGWGRTGGRHDGDDAARAEYHAAGERHVEPNGCVRGVIVPDSHLHGLCRRLLRQL